MNQLEYFATIIFFVQLTHSLEELSTGFHKKWYLFKMPFKTFLIFEICFSLFWGLVVFLPDFPFRLQLLAFFLALMFANGVQHIVWAGSVKRYVPGPFKIFHFLNIFFFFFFIYILFFLIFFFFFKNFLN